MFTLVVCRFKAIFKRRTGRTFSLAMEELWKSRALGGRDMCVPTFKTLTMQRDTLCNKDVLHDGYWPKMLLYALDELFYVFDQVKWQRGMDEKLVVAYEILYLSVLQCTEQWHGFEKKGVPDALSLLNVNDACHLECLTWAVYDGALLVGGQPELPGNCQWCTVLASLYKHIYRGHDVAAHCPPYTLASWDCQERTEAFCQEGRLGSAQSGQWRASRPRRRSRSSSRCCSWTPAQGDWSGHSCGSPPNTPLRCHCGGPYPLLPTPCPSWPRLSMFRPMPSPAALAWEWPRPPLTMKMHGRMTSKPCTHLSAM